MATLQEVEEVFETLLGFYPRAEVTDAQIEAWAKALVDLAAEDLRWAAITWASEPLYLPGNTFFPSLAELVKLARRAPVRAEVFDAFDRLEQLQDRRAAGLFDRREWEALLGYAQDCGRPALAEAVERRLEFYLKEAQSDIS